MGGLSDLMAIACAVQATADAGAVPGSVVARDVQDDDAPGGSSHETWFQPGLGGGPRVFEWDGARLEWGVRQAGACAAAGGSERSGRSLLEAACPVAVVSET